MQFRDLQRQYQALKTEIDTAVLQVMNDCNFISGAPVKQLETSLSEYVGVKHCITCANGTDALMLAIMALGIGKGDAVFVPDFTFFSTAEAPAILGATPVFVDVCADTYNMDAESLQAAVERIIKEGKLKPAAVIAVDLFGLPADYSALYPVIEKYDLKLIEDGAQGFGGRIGNKRVCSFGNVSTTSFFPAKPLGCYGDGGAIFTDDDDMADMMRSLCVHGKGSDKYDNLRLGMNSRLDTIQAAVLRVKLDALACYELGDVNKVAQWYTERLSDSMNTPVVPPSFYSSWAQYTIRLPSRQQRNDIQAVLRATGIPTMIYYARAMHQQGAFADIPYNGECPVTEKLCETVLQLPIHPYLSELDVDTICCAILKLI